jgi:hypothetical protein
MGSIRDVGHGFERDWGWKMMLQGEREEYTEDS